MSKKILILGSTGMLGSMLSDFFITQTKFSVFTTIRKSVQNPLSNDTFQFNAKSKVKQQLEGIFKVIKPDYILNSIGIIKPYCKDNDPEGIKKAIQINALFPHILSGVTKQIVPSCKIIQIATDCVYDGKKENYSEIDLHNATDVYGKSKSLGEVIANNVINIRCSIIGPEIQNGLSLLNWFLSNKDYTEVSGYEHHIWNGITTLQFAELCHEIIAQKQFDSLHQLNHVVHYIKNTTVSKYELLNIINNAFNREIIIKKISDEKKIDRSISTIYYPCSLIRMEEAILNLKNYIEKSLLFNNFIKND